MNYLTLLAGIFVVAGVLLVVLRVWREVLVTRHRIRMDAAESQLRLERFEADREQLRANRRWPPVDSSKLPAGVDSSIETSDITMPTPPPALVRSLSAGEGILSAGPGLANPDGTPSLNALFEAIISKLEGEVPGHDWDYVQESLLNGEASAALDIARFNLSDEKFEAVLHDAIPSQQPDGSALWDLAEIPFSGAVTVDWSGVVRGALLPRGGIAAAPSVVNQAIDAFREGEFFLLEAAGSIWDPPLWISFDDMRGLAVADREYARFVISLLSTRSILFLGSDTVGLEEFLDCFPTQRSDRRHWALVPWEPRVELDRERFLRRYQVELLPYPPSEGHREATKQFVQSLKRQLPARRRSQGRISPEAERLRELRLQNIGPFEELQIELDRPTVLLGDNGSGKSSVLRAIALALVGDSADNSVARRMLKTTATRGEIELITDRGRYRTRLIGDRQRVRIETDGLPPIQSSGWLALGFPPMRGVSLANPRGPTGVQAEEPTPEDLLPLLSNGPDQRLDGLKQWVVNTAMRAEESSRGSHERDLLDRFFLVLKGLTPGAEFDYIDIDRKSWEVKLDSPDGPVSFDLLSRGMTAVMGWVGVLLQRLYEVYGDREGRPEEQRALVLVDEIDVHLHPEWQHLVLPLIGEHFPNIQLIVTTHSPLIVGNAKEGIAQLLHRVDDVPVAQRLHLNFSGWRSDQILTSPAFGLESTRDAATAAKHREYRDLLARGEIPAVNAEAKQLHEELDGKLPAEGETVEAREAAALFRTWLEERFEQNSPAERKKIVAEAELYLDRLYTAEDE